jgi:xanthine dehydrogenase/oxidase
LKGTKLGCEEGGCGACTVVLTNLDGVVSANSCLRLLCLNDGMSITTVEGIGSVKTGLSEEQQRLVAKNGSQCGFCTPGWITNMHALLQSSSRNGQELTSRTIQAYFDGNICRCTGYLPILEAFSSFANADDPHTSSCAACPQTKLDACRACPDRDIEDGWFLGSQAVSCKSNIYRSKNLALLKSYQPKPLKFLNAVTGTLWFRPLTIDDLCQLLQQYSGRMVQLVGGNTSIGVSKYYNETGPYYRADAVEVYIDINHIADLKASSFNQTTGELTVGAGVTISSTISLLKQYSNAIPTKDWLDVIDYRSLFNVLAHHLLKIANSQVRNTASLAGNLVLFLRYPSFPSDLVLCLTMANARLTICKSSSNNNNPLNTITMEEFLSMSYEDFIASGSFLVCISLQESNYRARQLTRSLYSQRSEASYVLCESFKIAQREYNAHAHVNAAFQYQLIDSYPPVILDVRVVFGGVSAKTFIAYQTQAILRNVPMTSEVLSRALLALQSDLLTVGMGTAFGDQKFRESVMQACLYRSLLRCYKLADISPALQSALFPWIKPEASGTEVFVPSSGLDPVGKPIHKLEAPIQATGEAIYPSDQQLASPTYHASMVFSTQSSMKLLAIDSSIAMKLAGVIAVYTAEDIPGTNTVGKGLYLLNPIGAEVKCIGLPVAIVVATTEQIADQAAVLVKALYDAPPTTLVTNIIDAMAAKSFYPLPRDIPMLTLIKAGDPLTAMKNSDYRVQGRILGGGQSHFYMETQTAIAQVVDGENIEIVCGTQASSLNQVYIASALGIAESQVILKNPRSGGGFGGKATRSIATASAAALCAMKLGRTVRIFNDRTADMIMTGGRESLAFDYEVGFTSSGLITALIINFFVEAGVDEQDAIADMAMSMNWADNAYHFPNYLAQATLVYTNTPARTFTRAPGIVQSCFATEVVVERVAWETERAITEVQELNFIQNGQSTINGQLITNCTLNEVWSTLYQRSRYPERYQAIESYNLSSIWRKRGISICPVKYGIGWTNYNAGVTIGTNRSDGTVMVSHTGNEMGQGINTKVAQTVAKELGIPVELIRITTSSTEKISNGGITGGSGTSEVTCQAAINAAAVLNERFAPYRLADEPWIMLLSKLPSNISLNAEGWYSPTVNPSGGIFQYYVYAACVTEIALDVLSGQVHVLASEIVYDCGQSLNPAVDIGQIEGGFVFGLGYFLSEMVSYAADGTLETVGTWEYKPPLGSDIPSIFNVTFLRDVDNSNGIMGSKATGEPPNILANSAYFAVKKAIASARRDANEQGYFSMEAPMTIAVRQQECLVHPSRFLLPS